MFLGLLASCSIFCLLSSKLISVLGLNSLSRDETIDYMSHYDQLDVGVEYPHFEEPPPPYTAQKSPFDISPPPGDAPPPYEHSSQQQHTPTPRPVREFTRLSPCLPRDEVVQCHGLQQNASTVRDNETNSSNNYVQDKQHNSCTNQQSECCCHCQWNHAGRHGTYSGISHHLSTELCVKIVYDSQNNTHAVCTKENGDAMLSACARDVMSQTEDIPQRLSPVGSSVTDLSSLIAGHVGSISSMDSHASLHCACSSSDHSVVNNVDSGTLPNDALYPHDTSLTTANISLPSDSGSAECLISEVEHGSIAPRTPAYTRAKHFLHARKRTPPDGCSHVNLSEQVKENKKSDVCSPVGFTCGEDGVVVIGDDRSAELPRPRARLMYRDVSDIEARSKHDHNTSRKCQHSANSTQAPRRDVEDFSSRPNKTRLSRSRSIEKSVEHFKQYGFIDNPDGLCPTEDNTVKRRSSSLEMRRPHDSQVHRRTRSSGNERTVQGGARPKNRDSLNCNSSGKILNKRNVSRDTRQNDYAQRRREHKKQKRRQKHAVNRDRDNVSTC